MSATPSVDEMRAASGPAPALALVDRRRAVDHPEVDIETATGEGRRRFSIYSPMAAFDLIEEFDFLTRRAIDPNIYFAPQFLVPAMPRLDERKVRLMVLRDEAGRKSRMRLLMPFSVERSGLIGGPSVIRAWTHPFGPLGTIPLDADDPAGTLRDLLQTLARADLGFPDVLVLPDLRIGEPMAETLLRVASGLGLPVASAGAFERAALVKDDDPANYLKRALPPKRRRDIRRQRRLLDARGAVSFDVAQEPAAVRDALEEFLVLEASGWKGRERSALVMDRFRSAFAREAVNALAEKRRARIFTLRLDDRPIASLVAFVGGGEAYAWKIAYDEDHAAASPGAQLMAMVTEALLADSQVRRADSCAVPDHVLMNRFWRERTRIATLVVGLTPHSAKRVEAAAKGIETTRKSRNLARLMRRRLRAMVGLG